MRELPYLLFDADNHYYEALDAFTRHMDPRLARRTFQWAEIGGRKRGCTGSTRSSPRPGA
jgi:hypothetical protein